MQEGESKMDGVHTTKRQILPSIPGMTIGEERKCLNQIYRAVRNVDDDSVPDPNWLLYNGQTAGLFALKYIVGHYKKRKYKENMSKCQNKKQSSDIDIDGIDGIYDDPAPSLEQQEPQETIGVPIGVPSNISAPSPTESDATQSLPENSGSSKKQRKGPKQTRQDVVKKV